MLFAMFARTHVFDPLLKVVTPDPKKRQVQLAIHYIVNQLRMGNISGAAVMRHAIVQLSACCDFPAADRIFEQQDASELFVILMDLLGAPLVPLYAHIYHGGKSSHSDEGVVTERIFPLGTQGHYCFWVHVTMLEKKKISHTEAAQSPSDWRHFSQTTFTRRVSLGYDAKSLPAMSSDWTHSDPSRCSPFTPSPR